MEFIQGDFMAQELNFKNQILAKIWGVLRFVPFVSFDSGASEVNEK